MRIVLAALWLALLLPMAAAAEPMQQSFGNVILNATHVTTNGTPIAVSGYTTALLQFTGYTNALDNVVVVPEVSGNYGATFVTQTCYQPDGTATASVSNAGIVRCNVAGATHLRTRITTNRTGVQVTIKGNFIGGGNAKD